MTWDEAAGQSARASDPPAAATPATSPPASPAPTLRPPLTADADTAGSADSPLSIF